LIEAGAEQAGIEEGDIEETAAAAAAAVGADDGVRHFALLCGKPKVKGSEEGAIALQDSVVHGRHCRRITTAVQSGEKGGEEALDLSVWAK
jgi:hypothetical protein